MSNIWPVGLVRFIVFIISFSNRATNVSSLGSFGYFCKQNSIRKCNFCHLLKLPFTNRNYRLLIGVCLSVCVCVCLSVCL